MVGVVGMWVYHRVLRMIIYTLGQVLEFEGVLQMREEGGQKVEPGNWSMKTARIHTFSIGTQGPKIRAVFIHGVKASLRAKESSGIRVRTVRKDRLI